MSKILIIGHNPLPFEKGRLWSGGIRTWHLTKALMEGGHKICLIGVHKDEKEFNEKPKTKNKLNENLIYYSFSYDKIRESRIIQKIHDKFNPDCIIGINSLPSKIASEIKTDKPFWADLNGWAMAEMQAKSATCKSNMPLKYAWYLEKPVIKKADIFSVVSIPQKYVLIGELASIGRLNKETYRYDFVHYIPNSIDKEKFKHEKIIFRNKFSKKDFVILWAGGYNTWADVDTLFNALEKAMSINKRIKFVSTGGKIKSQDELTFSKFLEKVEKSKFKDNFLFLGWLPTQDVKNCYFEADIGINTDRNIYETEIGARNRFLDMMKAGLPIVTSLKSEISSIIKDNKIGYTYKIENADELANLIIKLSKTPKKELQKIGKKAQNYTFKNFTYEKTAKPLLEWAKNPKHSPDYKKRIKLTNLFWFIFSKIEKYPSAWRILRYIKRFL
ncbi:MAG: glycosyltransferase [Candidatus Pacearchaeota archaeon]